MFSLILGPHIGCFGNRRGTVMKNISGLIGKKAALVRLADSKSQFQVELQECLRNNILLVSSLNTPESIVGQRYQIRFVENNVTYSYHTKVVRVCNDSTLCLQILLPNQKDHEVEQRVTRVPVDKKEIKITLQDGKQQISVGVLDISVNGARLVSNVRLGQINDVFNIELTLKEGARSIRLPCRIRYVRTELAEDQLVKNVSFHHGVEFLQLTTNVENFLFRFVS